MKDAMTAYDTSCARNGVALHARTDGPIRGLRAAAYSRARHGRRRVAPAGAINASAIDMALWMQVQLAHGKLPNGGRLFSEEQAADDVEAAGRRCSADAFSVSLAITPKFQDYALGWFIEDYHGHTIVEHTGAVLGAVAALYLIPEKNVGVAVMINSEDGASRRAVAFHVLDHYLGLPDQDWNVKLKTIVDGMVAEGEKADEGVAGSR
jgi:CubicO group peptidase (beta-lactamase class C family)